MSKLKSTWISEPQKKWKLNEFVKPMIFALSKQQSRMHTETMPKVEKGTVGQHILMYESRERYGWMTQPNVHK